MGVGQGVRAPGQWSCCATWVRQGFSAAGLGDGGTEHSVSVGCVKRSSTCAPPPSPPSLPADVEFGRIQARDLLQHLWTGPISNAPVEIIQVRVRVWTRAACSAPRTLPPCVCLIELPTPPAPNLGTALWAKLLPAHGQPPA